MVNKLIVWPSGTGTIYHYKLPSIQLRSDTFRKPISEITIPNRSKEDNPLFSMEGGTITFNLSFTIIDDGTDRSDGTATPSTIITVTEQEQYLIDRFMDTNVTTKFWLSLTGLTSSETGYGDDRDGAFQGILGQLSVTDREGFPNKRDVDMKFQVGKSGG